ncbi:MAG: HD domain-containing phosphohydrolase [Alphaproteobacteria bacterium]|nr:HD domain-containing phosphohydrolase [Alphaproteobacteria bacterium]
MATRIPRPDARNSPRLEMYARLLAALGALFLLGAVLMWMFLADPGVVSRLFFGGGTVTSIGVLKLGGAFTIGAVLLGLILHPVMRALILSKVAPRTLDAGQRAAIEMVPSPMFFVNAEARIEEVNSAFAKAMGRSVNTIIGRSLYDLIPKDQQEEAYKAFLKATSGEEDRFLCMFNTRHGPRTFQIQAEPYQGHNADTRYLVGTAIDVTEEVDAADALQSQYRNLRTATAQTLEEMAHVVEIRDPYLHGHHARVTKLVGAICDELKLPAEEKEGIEVAARAHDIGTIQIPFEIQIKPGQLSEAECAIVELHAQAGADILARVDFPWPVAKIVAQHHEFFDGTGYPNGIKGKDILIGARILAVADAYDALTSQRPYRAAISRGEALQRLMTLSGTHYDPRVVTALTTILQKTTSELR